MKTRSIITTILFLAIAFCASASNYHSNSEQLSKMLPTSTSLVNQSDDNVAGMVMDGSYTYVIQNLEPNPSVIAPYYSYSLSGALGVYSTGAFEHASVVVDRIDNSTGTTVILARIDILSAGSGVTATGITLYNNKLYIVGYFTGTVKPNGTLSSKTANAIDMFICTVNTTSTGVVGWNQSGGDGEEHATCIYNSLGTMYVGGYYTASASPSVSSTWPTSPVITAPGIGATGQRNTFIATFSGSTLGCTDVNGWMTLSNNSSSAQINGICTSAIAGTTVSYVTGTIIGGATNPPLSGSASGDIMFTARFVNKNLFAPPAPNTWGWAVLEGVYLGGPHPSANCGKAIIFGSSTELYVAGAAAYSGTLPTGYQGLSDAVVVKYTGITGTTPTKAFVIPMGTGTNDSATALIYDGSNVCVTGNMASGNFAYASIGNTTITDTSSALSHVFVARYLTSGALDWQKTSYGYSWDASSDAIACNGGCELAFGGAYDRRLTWDTIQKQGLGTPSTYRIYANFLPVQKVVYTVPFADKYILNNTSSTTRTATGATSYVWSYDNSMYTGLNISLSAPTSATNMTTLNSGGFPGSYFDIITTGSYTRNGSCTTVTKTRVYQTTLKWDGEDITGVEDMQQSINTLNVFPNPFVQQLSFNYSFASTDKGMLRVLDLQGRVISEMELGSQSGTEQIDSHSWAAGTYVINLLQNNKVISSKQIIKQ